MFPVAGIPWIEIGTAKGSGHQAVTFAKEFQMRTIICNLGLWTLAFAAGAGAFFHASPD